MTTQDDVLQMLDDCEKRSEKLTDWELGFVDDVQKQIETRPLSLRQLETLERIWERVT